MSNDSFTHTSSTSWFSRIGRSIVGVMIGIILFIASFPLLTWNEGRAIKRAKTLDAGSKSVVTVDASPVDPANEGRLVHFSGEVVVEGDPVDGKFGITAPAVMLLRNVEMYQWVEDTHTTTKKTIGGGEKTETTYNYQKRWEPKLIDSRHFKKSAGHENPGELPFKSDSFTAEKVKVGDFTLPASLIAEIDTRKEFVVSGIPEEVDPALAGKLKVSGGGFYLGGQPSAPEVGDIRVTFEFVPPGPVSVVAAQHRDTLGPFAVEKLGSIALLQTGIVSAEEMFETERQSNVLLTWLVRLGGFVMMGIGLSMVMAPLGVLADVIPFIGGVVSAGTTMIAFLVAFPLSLVTIAVAWIAVRPFVGIPLMILAVGAVAGGFWLVRKRRGRVVGAV